MSPLFISYSRKDSAYAHALADSLQGMDIPVWIDARLDYGSQWPHELQKQLDGCEAFILIMSPSSYASEWVQSELQRAKRKFKPVFPLLLEGEEPWLSVESTQYYDVRNRELPDQEFYADLERAVSMKQTVPPVSPTQGVTKKTGSAKNIQTGIKVAGLLAVLAILSICLAVSILLFQRVAERSPSVLPTGLEASAAQPTTSGNTSSPAIQTGTSSAATVLPVELPDGSEATMIAPRGEKVRYTILSAEREPYPPHKYLLHLRIRVWTESIALNFWNDSFRLVAGDLSLAPVSFVNEVVDRNETVDGDVEFEIDPSLKEAVLVITAGLYHSEPWAKKELRLVFP